MTILANAMLTYNYWVREIDEKDNPIKIHRLIMVFIIPLKPLLDVILLFLIRRKEKKIPV